MRVDGRKYCTEVHVKRILPEIAEYDGKVELKGWSLDSGSIYKSSAVGIVSNLFKDGIDLDVAKDNKAGCVSEDDWFYENNVVYIFSSDVPEEISSGEVWSVLLADEIKRASEQVDLILGNSDITHGWLESDYDYIIIYGCASIVVGNRVRAYDIELADKLEKIYNSDEPKGLLQKLADGTIGISFYDAKQLSRGVIIAKVTDDVSTWKIESLKGIATDNDIVKLQITTGGTFEYGVTSPVFYKVMGNSEDGFMLDEVLSGTRVNGDFQDLANGIQIKMTPGVYKEGDYYHVKMSKNVKRKKNIFEFGNE